MKTIQRIVRLVTSGVLGAVVGCSQTLTFKVVDAKTFQPLSGVVAIVDTENMAYSGYVDIVKLGGVTDGDGRTTVADLRTDGLWRTSVLFSGENYCDAGFRLVRGERSTVMKVPSRLFADPEIESIVETDTTGAIIIKMFRATDADNDTELKDFNDNPHVTKRAK